MHAAFKSTAFTTAFLAAMALQARAADFSASGFNLGISFEEVKSKLGPGYVFRDVTLSNIPTGHDYVAYDPRTNKYYSIGFFQDRAIYIYYSQVFPNGSGPKSNSMWQSVLQKYGSQGTNPILSNAAERTAQYSYAPDGHFISNVELKGLPGLWGCSNIGTTPFEFPGTTKLIPLIVTFNNVCARQVNVTMQEVGGVATEYQVEINDGGVVWQTLHNQQGAVNRAREQAAPTVKPGDL